MVDLICSMVATAVQSEDWTLKFERSHESLSAYIHMLCVAMCPGTERSKENDRIHKAGDTLR